MEREEQIYHRYTYNYFFRERGRGLFFLNKIIDQFNLDGAVLWDHRNGVEMWCIHNVSWLKFFPAIREYTTPLFFYLFSWLCEPCILLIGAKRNETLVHL